MADVVPPSRTSRKAKGEGHERRGEILAAAERIFVEKGYEGATIRKIADEVGLSSTALYMHFADKGEILNEICRNAFNGLLERQMVCMEYGADPVSCVRDLAHGYIAFGLEYPNAYKLAFMMPVIAPEGGGETVAQKAAAQLYANFLTSIQIAVDAGELFGDVRCVAQVLWASVHGLTALMITKPYFDWVDQNLLIQQQVSALLKGFSTK